MVASVKTIEGVCQVLNKHLDEDKIKDIVRDLTEIPGNKSFTDTVQALAEIYGVDEKLRS